MGIDKGAFETNPRPEKGDTTPFHEQLQEGEQNRSKLQHLSPDKKVFDVDQIGNLSPQERQQLDRSLNQAVEQWSKVVEPLRQVFNNWKQKEMSGTDNGASESWAKNYMAKVGEVLRDNMNHLSGDMDFRIACPVQCFLPSPNGGMTAKTLHAFYPPLPSDTQIQDRYVTMALHSDDPALEAQLQKNRPSPAHSISSHELEFRFKVNNLLPRKLKQDIAS